MRRAHVWTGNVTPQRVGVSSRRLSVLDRNISELVNFDEGGLWNPSGPIIIGGKGMELNNASLLHGGVITKPGYGGNYPRIELTDQWPYWTTPRTISKTVSWIEGVTAGPIPQNTVTSSGTVVTSLSSANTVTSIHLDGTRLHDNATITKVTYYLRYFGTKPTLSFSERFGITRRGTDGSADATYLHSAGVSGDMTYTTDYAERTAALASSDVYFNNGATIAAEYVPNQNNVVTRSRLYEFWVRTSSASATIQAELLGLKIDYSVSDQRFE